MQGYNFKNQPLMQFNFSQHETHFSRKSSNNNKKENDIIINDEY